MYKDKDKQREAVKMATRRHRAKGITKVSPEQGITVINERPDVIPENKLTLKQVQQAHEELSQSKVSVSSMVANMMAEPVDRVPEQNTNPMRVGYVPPRGGA